MSERIIITCDVIGCEKEGCMKVDCCTGWKISDGMKHFKKLERPLNPQKKDLCKEHFIEWSKLTIKFMKMDKEII